MELLARPATFYVKWHQIDISYLQDGPEYDTVTSAPAANEAFKWSMLKASLDFNQQIPKGERGFVQGTARRNTRSSFGKAMNCVQGKLLLLKP